ncbi:MAG: glycosyltransferase [Microcoleaceae cyanobacterium MO_207.B10]|nr:glycosyltransferase [Microcoleaceae cyanobacterium MO_207.B10]
MIKCKICDSTSLNFAEAYILNKKYKIDYFQCQNCNFIQTEYPYWLSQAYTEAIATSDEGLIFRNLMLSHITKNIINRLFNPDGNFLDFGGGYGIFTRLMRDIKYKFYWEDKYCKNLFAQNFQSIPNQKYELVTAFELFEHLVNPIAEIKEILNYSKNILFSTEILPPYNPQPNQWWYYALNEGQHISIYTVKSLQIIAEKFNLNLYTNGSSLHLLTEKKILSKFCEKLLEYDAEKLRRILRQNRDYLQCFEIINSQLKSETRKSNWEEINFGHIYPSKQKPEKISDKTPATITSKKLPKQEGETINLSQAINLQPKRQKTQKIPDIKPPAITSENPLPPETENNPSLEQTKIPQPDKIADKTETSVPRKNLLEQEKKITLSNQIKIPETEKIAEKISPVITSENPFLPETENNPSSEQTKIPQPDKIADKKETSVPGKNLLEQERKITLSNQTKIPETEKIAEKISPVITSENYLNLKTEKISSSEQTKIQSTKQQPEKMPEIRQTSPTLTTPQKLGINIAGFIKGELGIGEGVRATLRAIETTNIPFVINNIISTPHRNSDQTYQNFTQENPHPINLFQVNANEVKTFLKKPSVKQYFANKYNIGFWAWELPKFPPEWITAFTPFNEIWTYSNYCAESISMVSPIPVIKMMPSINLPIPKISREELGLPKEKFIFLFIFDFFSRLERKNPLATITAFKQAFINSNPDVLLLIKSSNSQKFPHDKLRLINSIRDSPNIKHIDGYLSKDKINALLYHCNCYVSLHRAEGFGLTMAEAMFYGKPVIATGYSSNTEFMNVGNSFLVEYEKVAITEKHGPYKQGDIWANPNIEHCANLMKYVFNNYRQAEKIGIKAAQDIKSLLTPETIGKKIKTRLQHITQITENFTNIPATKLSPNPNTNKFPLVSICIPTYNGEKFIEAAINSAISQTYPNLEIIISDDNSTDKTIGIVKGLQRQNPQINFRILLHQNYGLVGNLNFCISEAKGKYIKFLLQDDLLENNCIEELVKLAEQDTKIGLVFSRRRVILEPGAEKNSTCIAAYRGTQDLYKDWSNLQTVQSGKDLLLDPNLMKYRLNKIGEPTTVLVPKVVFEKIGLFDPSLTQVLDIDMWLRIMGNYKIGFVDKSLSKLRIHPRQQTQLNLASGKNSQDYQRFYQKILENPTYNFLIPEVKATVRQKLGFLSNYDFSQVANLVAEYRRYPTNESVLNSLRQLRRLVAEKLLGFSQEQLKFSYLGEIGRVYKLLLHSGIKNEVLTDSEWEFVGGLQINFSGNNLLQEILAFLLYRFAFELPINYRCAVLPRWIFADFLGFLFAAPLNFQDVGDRDKYCEYVRGLMVYLKGNVFSNSHWEVKENIAAFLTYDVDLSGLVLSDLSLLDFWQQVFAVREFCLQSHGYQLDFSFPEKTENIYKIRLGILLDKLSFKDDTFAVISLLENLGRHEFEIVLYYFSITNDMLGVYCQKADWSRNLSGNLSEQVNAIRADKLDILLIATNPADKANSFCNLALHRLARRQITTSALPNGIQNLDYSIVGEKAFCEAPPLASLVTLPGSGLSLNFPPPTKPTVGPTRASWGADSKTIIFISGAHTHQLYPEQRQTWLQIIAAVPNSILVLCPYRFEPEDYQEIWLWKQMQLGCSDFGLDKHRIIVIKNLKSREDFQKCLNLADVYLDAFLPSDITPIAECFLLGIPTVVRESQTLKSRQIAALITELELPELITHTEKEYMDISVALATDQNLRWYYRNQIQQKMASNPKFLDGHTYAEQICYILQ